MGFRQEILTRRKNKCYFCRTRKLSLAQGYLGAEEKFPELLRSVNWG